MNQHAAKKRAFKKLLRDERGAVAIVFTVYLPVLVGFFTLAIDMSYIFYSRNLLQVAAESSALAASSQLPNRNNVIAVAHDYANKNMPISRFGNVLSDQDIVLGYWPSTCKDPSCFVAATSAGSCAPNQCNAVQVTTRQTLNLSFVSIAGFNNTNVNATAIAVAGPGSQSKWNVNVVEDVSASFAQEIGDAKKADIALLDCMKQDAQPGSQMGITVFAEKVKTLQTLSRVDQNSQAIKDTINSLDVCGKTMKDCYGTDLAGGMNSAIDQMCKDINGKWICTSSGITGARQAMVVITDGQPNICSGRRCDPKKKSEDAADKADDNGIDVFTIYYGNTDSDATWLAGLVRGKGQTCKAPSSSDLASCMQQVCQNVHRLVW